MNELNFKPATGGGFAGDRTVAVPALDTSAAMTGTVTACAMFQVTSSTSFICTSHSCMVRPVCLTASGCCRACSAPG